MTAPVGLPAVTSIDRALHERYASQVKSRLARPRVTVEDVRDGLLDCFLSTYHHGVALGLKGIVALEGTEDEVARVTSSLFRRKLRELGSSFEAPTVGALSQLKDILDRELHYVALPADLRGVHDQVCSLLLAKVGAAPEHTVDVHAPTTAVTGAPTTTFARDPRPADLGLEGSSPALATAGASPVTAHLRAALAGHLEAMAHSARSARPAAGLAEDLERAARLLTTLREFEPG